MLNHVTVIGRLTADPELRKTQSGVSVCSFTVAVDRDFVQKGEERQADFITVVAWRNTADFVCKFFSKGRMIAVDGSLQSRKWQDKNGQTRSAVEIQASSVYFADSGKRDGNGKSTASSYHETSESAFSGEYGDYQGSGFAAIEEDGSLPF